MTDTTTEEQVLAEGIAKVREQIAELRASIKDQRERLDAIAKRLESGVGSAETVGALRERLETASPRRTRRNT